MAGFEKFTHEHAELVTDEVSQAQVLHVQSPHAMVQACGYLKYTRAQDQPYGVYFRGQERLYSTLCPALYRGLTKPSESRGGVLDGLLSEIETTQCALRHIHPAAREPLLQHYGIRTRWLDVVDNVWVALWFSVWRAIAKGKYGEYLHFERRNPHKEEPCEQYCYILLLGTELDRGGIYRPGFAGGPRTEVVDLRRAAPSHFVRPHAQHALLIRRVSKSGATSLDFTPLIVGVVRAHLVDAIGWLGDGQLLSTHSLFPPPGYDPGYRELLSGLDQKHTVYGAIHHVAP